MIVRKQRIIRHGTSNVVVIPSQMQMGEEATIAADRLMLVDPRGEISEEILGQLIEQVLEPALYAARQARHDKNGTRGKLVVKEETW